MGRMVTPRAALNPTPKLTRRRTEATAVLGPLLMLMGAGILVWAACFWFAYTFLS